MYSLEQLEKDTINEIEISLYKDVLDRIIFLLIFKTSKKIKLL